MKSTAPVRAASGAAWLSVFLCSQHCSSSEVSAGSSRVTEQPNCAAKRSCTPMVGRSGTWATKIEPCRDDANVSPGSAPAETSVIARWDWPSTACASELGVAGVVTSSRLSYSVANSEHDGPATGSYRARIQEMWAVLAARIRQNVALTPGPAHTVRA